MIERLVLAAALVISIAWIARSIASSARSTRDRSGGCAGCPFQTSCKGGASAGVDCEDNHGAAE